MKRSPCICRFFSILLVLGCICLLYATVASAITYNANADFGDSNPNGVWSYGWSDSVSGLPSNLIPYNTYGTASSDPNLQFGGTGFEGWYDSNNFYRYSPIVYKNYGDNFEDDPPNKVIPAGALILHGVGESSNYVSVVEFTAPSTGQYSLSAIFIGRQYGLDFSGPCHIYVLNNGITIFEDINTIKTVGDSLTYSSILNLLAGEKIDFVVGKDDGIYRNNIELQATINPVPLPGGLLLLSTGLLCLAGWRGFRKG